MKSINKFLITSCTLLAMISCTKEVEAPQANERPQAPTQDPALCDTDFIGVIDQLNGVWVSDAQVLVYDGVSEEPLTYKVSEIEEDTRCVLSGQVFSNSDMYFAFYPADGIEGFADGIVTVEAAASQVADQARACVAAAVTTDSVFTFSPIASYIKIKVITDDLKSISVKAGAGEAICGKYQTTIYNPEVREITDAAEEIVLSAEGESIAKGEYYVQVLPGDYSSVKLTVTYTDGSVYRGNRIEEPLHLGFGDVFEFGKVFDEVLTAPVIEVDQVAFSSARVTWTASPSAVGYNIYLDGQKVEELPADASSYLIKDLALGSEHTVALEFQGETTSEMSREHVFKTAGIRMLDNGRHHVTIEWDEVGKVYNGTVGSGDGLDRGYYIGVYKDAACTQAVYEFCPYDAMTTRYYGYSTSSLLGKVGGKSYWIPTRIALGSLEQDTEYFVRLKTYAGFSFSYSGTTYTVEHPYGITEWSAPLSVRTKPARQAAAGEVIFADFDELSVCPDRYIGAIGTVPATWQIGDCTDMRAISIGYTVDRNIDAYGIAETMASEADAKHRDYFNGKYFNVGYDGSAKYTNYIIKEGYELVGWHMSNNVRPAMGTVVIDRAKNRMIGTPALTANLSAEGTPCVLTFDQCVFLNAAAKEDVLKIWIYRDGALSDPIYTYTVKTDSYASWTDASNYEIEYKYTKKSFPLTLKVGDAVIIGTNNETLENYIAIDNFKITVSDAAGSGSLEIPDWGNDDDSLEI